MKKELTKVDKKIKQMMLDFPGIFPSKIECWIHLFATNGTGYEWNKEGEPDCYLDNPNEKHAIKIPYPEKRGDEIEGSFIKRQLEIAKIDLRNRYINFLCNDDIYNIFTERTALSISSIPEWALMVQASKNPEKIDSEWRNEIFRFCEWFKGSTWKFVVYDFCIQLNNRDIITDEMILEKLDGSKLRKIRELHHNYKIVMDVMENVLLPEEKEKKRQHEIKMREMVEDIVDRIKKEEKKG